MGQRDLPQRWQDKLKEYLESIDIDDNVLSASHFPGEAVKLIFEDGSSAEFKYALLIDAAELSEVGVFTEHCGYHIFSRNALTHFSQLTADSSS